MNNIQRELLQFFITFINQSSLDTETSNILVRRMMKDKAVQELIINCLLELEPILILNLSQMKSTSSRKYLKHNVKEPKLQILAKEIKNLMNNFDLIKGSLASVSELVDNLENSFLHKQSEQKPKFQVNQTTLVKFLSDLSEKKNLPDFEIEEISKDTWQKHLVVEKMLAAELCLYEIRWNSMENLHFRRISQIKEKTGVKIRGLEEQLKQQEQYYIKELAREGMKLEDKLGAEFLRDEFEKGLLSQEIDEVFVPDLLTAVEKIKDLLQIRQILEFHKSQDEKIIKMMNWKIQVLSEEYVEIQENYSKALRNLGSLSGCLEKVLKKSMLQDKTKAEMMDLMVKNNFSAIEIKFNEPDFMNQLWNENDLRGIRKSLIYNNKEIATTRVSKLLLSSENLTKTKVKCEIKAKSKTPRINTNHKNTIPSPLTSPGKGPDSLFFSVKKIITSLDADLKSRNKKVVDSLSAISASFIKQKQKIKEIPIKTKISEAKPVITKNFSELTTQTDIDFSKFNKLDQSTETLLKEFDSDLIQTDLSLIDLNVMEKKLSAKDIRLEFFDYMKDKVSNKETQTNKKIVFKEFEDSKLLARGIMRKYTAPNSGMSNERKFANELSSYSSHIAKSIETGITSTPIEANNEELNKAAMEYSKEFGIYSQFLGYKKLDFPAIQKLWEEVINRRLVEGENDKITRFLQGIGDSQYFESEKLKIIEMLMKVKKHSILNESYEIIVKDFKKKLNVLNRWRKFLIVFFKKHSGAILSSTRLKKNIDIYILSVFLRIVKQDLRSLLDKSHIMKRSETSLIFKNDKWVNKSNSPILINKQIIKSRLYKSTHNQIQDRFTRSKTPSKSSDRKKLPLVIR